MSHEMLGCNKAGEEVAYVRFSMGNYHAVIMYDLLEANEFNAGVSGSGRGATYSPLQMKKAWSAYEKLFENRSQSGSAALTWEQEQIKGFIMNCLATAQKEGSVELIFC